MKANFTLFILKPKSRQSPKHNKKYYSLYLNSRIYEKLLRRMIDINSS